MFSPTAMDKIGQKCLKWVIFVKNYGKISYFKYFWAILPIEVGKTITDSDGFNKIHHENG
jgi:hypothetical protein